MIDIILFPSSYFNTKKVDEDLQQEYNAVLSTGLCKILIFGYEQWFDNNKLILNDFPNEEHLAIYRGWMMKPEQYERFYNLLLKKNIRLVTAPKYYILMHIFPNAYKDIKEDTAKMEIYPLKSKIDVEKLKKSFDKFIIKDYVKSVKGTEFPVFFDQSINQKDFDNWMDVFYKYRGELLTGGICVKEFLDLKHYGKNTNEYRVFYANNKIISVSRNSDQENNFPKPPKNLIEKYCNLNSPYYSIDYAELENGNWKIIEVGDGQVSGLSKYQDYEQYFTKLFQCFNILF